MNDDAVTLLLNDAAPAVSVPLTVKLSAEDAVAAVVAVLALPFKFPIILPDTCRDPDICTSFPAAYIRLLLLLSSVPLPIIKAAGTDDTALNCPCTC